MKTGLLVKYKKWLQIVIHVAVWGCFFLLPHLFRPQGKDIAPLSARFITLFVTSGIALLLFYYFNSLVLIPKYLITKKWLLYFATVAACFLVFMYVPREVANKITPPDDTYIKVEVVRQNKTQSIDTISDMAPRPERKGGGRHKSKLPYFPGSSVIFFLILTISICIAVTQQWLRTDAVKKDIETEKLNTELSFLKSQINPHFFFNTLNNIYSLAVVGSDKTAPAVMKLSSIMRYILTETDNATVPLENEVQFLKNFIDLQMMRLTDKVTVNFTTEGNITNQQIAPLLLIPFVENAFKYGVSTRDNSYINISLTTTENHVQLQTVNTIVKGDTTLYETTSIGIANVKRRLDLLYKDGYDLHISDNGTNFYVTLDIKIK